MESKYSQLIDEPEIRNLVSRLAQLSDRADTLDEYISYFTEEAVCEYFVTGDNGQPILVRHGGAGKTGIAEDRHRLREQGIQGPGTNTFHINTTLVVTVRGDIAEAQSYWLFIDGSGVPNVRHVGLYEDRFRRTSDGWKLEYRRTTMNAPPM